MLQVTRAVGEDLEDLVVWSAYSAPSFSSSSCSVRATDCVAGVRCRRDQFEEGLPVAACCQGPEGGGEDPVDGGVLAVVLGQGALASDAVDEGDPGLRHAPAEGRQSDDLHDDLQRVDERAAGDEGRQNVGRDLCVVVEHFLIDGQDEAPSIPASVLGRCPGRSGDVASFVPTFPVQVERVSV